VVLVIKSSLGEGCDYAEDEGRGYTCSTGWIRRACELPVDFKVHEPYMHPSLKELQRKLKDADYVNLSNQWPPL
jgi:hypothetical protein